MPWSRFFLVGSFILLLCLSTTANAGHLGPTPAPPSDSKSESQTVIINDLSMGEASPKQTLISPDTLMTTLPKTWPSLVLAAGPYARFRTIVIEATRTPPKSADDLEQLMIGLASFDGPKLSKAFHAHAILNAMQTSVFFEGVEKWGRTYDRDGIIRNLHINPAYVEQMPGYNQARERVLKAIEDDGRTTLLAGSLYKDLAYSLQRSKWASKIRGGKALRLASLRNAYLAPQGTPEHLLQALMNAYAPPPPMTIFEPAIITQLAGAPTSTSLLTKIVRSIGPDAAIAASPTAVAFALPAPIIAPSRAGQLQDILASAALHILNPGAPYPTVLPPRNTPDYLAECVDWARLHLNQCVAATRYIYEDSFCIARHQLQDTGQCIAAFTGMPQSATH